MSNVTKIHFLYFHFDFYPESLAAMMWQYGSQINVCNTTTSHIRLHHDGSNGSTHIAQCRKFQSEYPE